MKNHSLVECQSVLQRGREREIGSRVISFGLFCVYREIVVNHIAEYSNQSRQSLKMEKRL